MNRQITLRSLLIVYLYAITTTADIINCQFSVTSTSVPNLSRRELHTSLGQCCRDNCCYFAEVSESACHLVWLPVSSRNPQNFNVYSRETGNHSTVAILEQLANSDFTATSLHSTFLPWYSRLHLSTGHGCWVPVTNTSGQYNQVDMQRDRAVFSVATAGRAAFSGYQQWVKAYKISYSLDGITWMTYTEQGSVKTLLGNTDKTTIVRRDFAEPFMARFVRMHPTAWEWYQCIRWELYGCS